MKKTLLTSLLTALALLLPVMSFGQYREAFPGAEGYGRYTKGGRGGTVYHVTTLEDTGKEGSFRYAVEKSGPRTIVFDVDGTIHLKSVLKLRNGFVTIAGQTAPGDGICIADYPFEIQASNVIIRFMRFRPGNRAITPEMSSNGACDGWDGLGALDQKYIIVDHCSVSWSIDECLSFSGCSFTTVQWCLVSQPLARGHSKLDHCYGGNWGGRYASYHHNVIAHAASRVPRLGPRPTTQLEEYMDLRNNIFYNYGKLGSYGGEDMNVNIVNNYYKPGNGNSNSRIAGVGIRTNKYCEDSPAYLPALHKVGTYYVDGNTNIQDANVAKDNWANGFFNHIDWSGWDDLAKTDTQKEELKKQMKLSTPIEYCYTTTHPADRLMSVVPPYVGASLHRDKLDEAIISDVTFQNQNTYGTTKCGTGSKGAGFIDNIDDVKKALGFDYPELKSGTAKVDTDGDGIPDEWETANKLDPNDKDDGAKDSGNGYTNLELYMNSLVQNIIDKRNGAFGKLLNGTTAYSASVTATTLPAYDPSAVYTFEPTGASSDPGEEEDSDILYLTFSNATESYPGEMTEPYGKTTSTNPHMLTWPSGATLTVVHKDNKTLGGGNTNNKIKPIKLSKGASHRLTLPEDFTTDKIEFIGYSRDGETSWIADITHENNGNFESIYSHDGKTDYVPTVERSDWESMASEDMPVITCNLSKAVGGTIWFKNGGVQPSFYIRIYRADKSAITDVIDDPREQDMRVFNLMGVEMRDTENLAPGIYIRGGKKFLVR